MIKLVFAYFSKIYLCAWFYSFTFLCYLCIFLDPLYECSTSCLNCDTLPQLTCACRTSFIDRHCVQPIRDESVAADQLAAEGRVKRAKHKTKEMIFRWKGKAGEERTPADWINSSRRQGPFLALSFPTLEEVAEDRMLAKLLAIMDNASHPLHKTLDKLKSSFSNRLIQFHCLKERHQTL